MSSGKFYVTTPIYYVNAPPHIGHALTSIEADVLARHRRLKGDKVFFLTGTDEHGAKIVRAAKDAGKETKKFVDDMAEKFIELKNILNLSADDFIRTSDKRRHWPGVELMWRRISEAGDLYKKTYKGLYCIGHEAFVTEKDLLDGKCADHGKEPEIVEEENYFFRLSKYADKIQKAIKSGKLKILPEGRKNEVLSFIKEGLEDISFSRPRKDLEWGIPVPGDPSQTIYVWCDALTNYLSAIGFGNLDESGKPAEGARRFSEWWPADVHLIGKDILRFHAVIWPAMLLSAGLELPKSILAHGFITVEGKKMSKTLGNVVDPFALVEKYGSDPLRYYLLREISTGADGDFSEKKFIDRYNGDLANGLGNFVARVLKVAQSAGLEGFLRHKPVREVEEKIKTLKKIAHRKIEEFQMHEALASVWELIAFGDEHANKTAPWSSSGKNRQEAVFDLLVILDNVSAMITPFLPETAEKITRSFLWQGDVLKIQTLPILFPRI